MSVRAYRVIEIKTAASSFNLWHDHKLVQLLDQDAMFFSNLNSDGTGISEVPVKSIRKAVRMSVELNLDEKTVEQLKQDIAAAKSSKDDCVTYYCF